MTRYMLDTNMVSYLLKGDKNVAGNLVSHPMSSLCISSLTEGELMYGVAKRPEATRLRRVVSEFLRRVEVLPWGSGEAQRYGIVRANLEAQGKVLSPIDLLIAVHALEQETILVTHDHAFEWVTGLVLEDWTAETMDA